MAQDIADRLGQVGATRDPLQLGREPGVQSVHERLAALLPDSPSLIGRAAADLRLHLVELADPAQRLLRQWRAGLLVDVIKAPPAMDHPNTIDGLHFKVAVPFVGAFLALPRQRRAPASR